MHMEFSLEIEGTLLYPVELLEHAFHLLSLNKTRPPPPVLKSLGYLYLKFL